MHTYKQNTYNLLRFPADNIRRKEEANEDVTTNGRRDENTSLIIGFATDIKPIPPVATQNNVVPSNQNCGVFMTSSVGTSLTYIFIFIFVNLCSC